MISGCVIKVSTTITDCSSTITDCLTRTYCPEYTNKMVLTDIGCFTDENESFI